MVANKSYKRSTGLISLDVEKAYYTNDTTLITSSKFASALLKKIEEGLRI